MGKTPRDPAGELNALLIELGLQPLTDPPPASKKVGNPLAILKRQTKRYSLLNRRQERELSRRVRSGDENARARLVLCNVGLVVRIAGQQYRHDPCRLAVLQGRSPQQLDRRMPKVLRILGRG